MVFHYSPRIMAIILPAFTILAAIVLCLHIVLSVGVCMNFARERRIVQGGAIPVLRPEAVVAVRNEEKRLPALLASLRAQTAAECRFLFVDDRSTDATPRLLDEFCREQGERARVIHNRAEPGELTGKQAALDLAFAQARGDVLLFTDGDCILPATWAEEMLQHFQDPRVGAVIGRIELPAGGTALERFQAFEQPLINQYNLGSVGIGVPTGCFGNNMAMRTAAVRETGGFATLGFSVTEDALMLDAIGRTRTWTVGACTSQRGAVTTYAKERWRDFIEQHTRWNAGGFFSPDLATRLLYIIVVLVYLVGSLVIIPLCVLDWRVVLITANSYLSIGLLAFLSGMYPGRDRGRHLLLFIPNLLFFGLFYSFITVRALLHRPFDWKGAQLRA
jgi:cellulose synthase/poly-beta-1,6-N-acetylglucosamine synthase-like glycosyltransferase